MSSAFGKYLLLDRISSGGMAEVFRAKPFGPAGLDRVVALKRILPHMAENAEFIDMFVDEAKICGRLKHENICELYAVGRVGEEHFLAMEYVWGKDVRQIQRRLEQRQRPAPPAIAAYLASKMCDGLDHAHRAVDAAGQPLHIIHRDVSPQNIVVSYEGDVKVVDFGIARAESRVSQTRAGVIKGKLGYMSPEQAWARPLDRRSDLFSVATILYELVTGARLFAGSDLQVLEAIRETKIVAPSLLNRDVPPALEAIILRGLRPDPDARYPWASEMAEALRVFLGGEAGPPTRHAVALWMHELFTEEVLRERPVLEAQRRLVAAATAYAAPPARGMVALAPPIWPPRRSRRPDAEPRDQETCVFGTSIDLVPDDDASDEQPSMLLSIADLEAAERPAPPPPPRAAPPAFDPSATPHRGELVVVRPPRRRSRALDVTAVAAIAGAVLAMTWRPADAPRERHGAALVVISAGAAGELLVDGEARGPIAAQASVTLRDVPLGEHRVVVRAGGHELERRVVVLPGEINVATIAAPPPPHDAGRIRLDVRTPAADGAVARAVADVFVDDEPSPRDATAPIELAVGAHQVRVEKHGMATERFTLEVRADETLVREVVLQPARTLARARTRAVDAPAPAPAPPPEPTQEALALELGGADSLPIAPPEEARAEPAEDEPAAAP